MFYLFPENPDTGMSAGQIVGIVFGCIIALVVAVLLILVAKRIRDVRRYREMDDNVGVAWDNPNYTSDTVQLENQVDDSSTVGRYGSDGIQFGGGGGGGDDFGYSSTY